MRVLIAGCGFAGTAIAERFVQAGHRVWGLRRDPSQLPAEIHRLAADLTQPASLRSLPSNLDIVVYCAAPDASTAAAYEHTYVIGLRTLLAELQRQEQRVRRFVLTSSTGVYSQSDGSWVDEATPTLATPGRSAVLLESERVALASPFPPTVVRLGGIYGPGRRRLLDRIRAGMVECVEGPPQYGNRIHRDDVAGVVVHLATLATAAELYLGVDHEPADRAEFLRWLAAQLGQPPPRTRPANADDRQGSNKRCANRRLLASGYSFRFPTYREGYADILRQLPD